MSKKSRKYNVDGVSYVFSFNDSGNLEGIAKPRGRAGQTKETPISPSSSEFTRVASSEEATRAYNIANYGGNTDAYRKHDAGERATQTTVTQQNQAYDVKTKKVTNESFVEKEDNDSTGIAAATPKTRSAPKIMQYPYDIDTKQDHLKISRYNYVRPNLNMSKSAGRSNVLERGSATSTLESETVAGDSVVGSDLKSVIMLPMPKVTDVNGVEWGKSELNSSGLTALNITNAATLGGTLSGKGQNDDEKAIREAIASRRESNSLSEGAAALYTGTVAKLAGTLTGSDLDADTFLARQGGKVLNPNAEMLFQGPVIRDFGFSFIMIARSQEEGKMIRSIIRELKLGMAPKFRSTTFLTNPDVFMLDYRNGNGTLNTVNRFSPGGLALTTMRVDYAPNGYWSAYRDSQPVAVKMDLDFTELRPIYEGDQLKTPSNSVGY